MADTKGVVVTFRGDTSQFENEVKKVNNSIRATKSDISALNKELKLDPSNVEKLTSKFNALKKLQEELTNKVQLYKDELAKFPESEVGSKEWSQLNTQLQRCQADLAKLNKELESMPTAQVQAIANKFNEIEDKLTKVGEAVTNVGKKFSVISGAVGGLIASGVKYNATLEQQTALFETLTGSAEEAQKIISSIQKSASLTPFSTEALISANQLLISTGIEAEKSQEYILALGNAVSATGGSSNELQRMAMNLQQIQNVGKATTMDIRQFAMAGIDIYGILSESTGKTVQELKDMDVTFDMITQALIKASGEGGKYAGAMEKQSETLNGKISTLKDNISVLLGELTAELLPVVKEILESIKDFVSRIKNLDKTQKDLILKIGLIVTALGPAILLIGTLITNIGAISGAIAKLLTSNGLTTFLAQVTTSGGGLIGVFKTLATTIMKVVNPVTAVIAVFGLLYTTNSEFRESVNKLIALLVESFKPVIDSIINVVKMLWETFQLIVTQVTTLLAPVFEFLIGVITTLLDWFGQLVTFIANRLKPWFDTIGKVVELVKNIFHLLFLVIRNDLMPRMVELKEDVQKLIDKFKGLLDKAKELWEKFADTTFGKVFIGILQKIGDMVNWVTGLFQGLVGWIGDAINKTNALIGVQQNAMKGSNSTSAPRNAYTQSGGIGVTANIHVNNNGTQIDTAEINRWVDQISKQVNRRLGRMI